MILCICHVFIMYFFETMHFSCISHVFIEALVEAATENIYGIYMEAGEREMSADRTETGDKMKTEGTGIKKETQAAITERRLRGAGQL